MLNKNVNQITNFLYRFDCFWCIDRFFLFLILLNSITLSIEHDRMDPKLDNVLNYINLIFTGLFSVEIIFKLITYKWKFFEDGSNVLDMIIVALAYAEIGAAGYSSSK